MEDNFSCFDDESEEASDVINNNLNSSKDLSERDEYCCGVLTFHPQTELSLLFHVKNIMQNKISESTYCDAERILKLIDNYCINRQWMMNIGPIKRRIVDSALDVSIQSFARNKKGDMDKFIAVELGTYCSYSAISIGLRLMEEELEKENKCFQLFTFDVNNYSDVAKEIINLSQLNSVITAVTIQEEDCAAQWMMKHIFGENNKNNTVQFLFLDHDKERYLRDFISFHKCGLLGKDTVVVADNVLFANINDYVSHVKQMEKDLVVKSRTVDTFVEYANGNEELVDALEITTFL